MINQTTKDKIQLLHRQYLNLAKENRLFLFDAPYRQPTTEIITVKITIAIASK